MLNRYLVAMLLSSLLLGCNGGSDGGEQTDQNVNDVTEQISDQADQVDQGTKETQEGDHDSTTLDSQDHFEFNEIQEGIKKIEKALEELDFVFTINENKISFDLLIDSPFSPRISFFRSTRRNPTGRTRFDLVSGSEYCSMKEFGLGGSRRFFPTTDEQLAECRIEILLRHERLIENLEKLEYLQRELLEKHADELTKDQQVTHLAKLKLSIQIKEKTKRFDRYLHEKQKFKASTWRAVENTLTREEIENIIIISDYKKSPYHVHLMASMNSPQLGELAEKGKITLLSDLEQDFAYDQRVLVYKTSLFTYVKLIDSVVEMQDFIHHERKPENPYLPDIPDNPNIIQNPDPIGPGVR